MRILSLDLSLTSTGWAAFDPEAIFKKNPEKHLSYATIKTADMRGMDRLANILRLVSQLADTADLAVVEDFAYGAKGRAIFEIGGLGYIIRYWLWKKGIPVVLVAPSQVKKFAAGKGNVDKNIVLREVYKRWDLEPSDDNAADAIVLNYIGQALADLWTPTTDFQRDVLTEVRKRNAAALKNLSCSTAEDAPSTTVPATTA